MKIQSAILEDLSIKLLATLDEHLFFSLLGKFLKKEMVCDNLIIKRVESDSSHKILSINDFPTRNEVLQTYKSTLLSYIMRTKKPYFSNQINRDPLFADEINYQKVQAELCIPILSENTFLGSIHLQLHDNNYEFGKKDIHKVLKILKRIKRPLNNIKMYLSARRLNQELLEKIKQNNIVAPEKNDEKDHTFFQLEDDLQIISQSPVMKKLLIFTKKIAHSDIAVLLTGESSVGKEMIAKKLHCSSNRKTEAFVSFDCSSIASKEFDHMFFGYDENYPDKVIPHKGLLELANKGTIFLNNVEFLPLNIQSKLNNVFDNKKAYRGTALHPFEIDIRLIAATTKNLQEMIENSTFKEDFYYTIASIELRIPSLKERKEDLESLSFLLLNKDHPIEKQKSLSANVVKIFLTYTWPGNIRELKNVLERAYLLSDTKIIERKHLNKILLHYIGKEKNQVNDTKKIKEEYKETTLQQIEKKHIYSTLAYLKGNKTKTAKMLGITVKTLYNKLHNYGVVFSSSKGL